MTLEQLDAAIEACENPQVTQLLIEARVKMGNKAASDYVQHDYEHIGE